MGVRIAFAFSTLALLWACSDEDPSSATPESDGGASSSSGGSSGSSGGDGSAGGDGASGDVDAGPPPILDPNFVKADYNQILLTGQSNAVANSSDPISTTQPYENVMFDVGVMTATQCDGEGCMGYQAPTSFVPLVEGDTFFSGSEVETSCSGFANEATKLAREIYLVGKTGAQADHVMIPSVHGRSGRTYNCLRKGGCSYLNPPYNVPFAEGVKQMEAAHALALAAQKTHVVRGIWAIHGESDSDTICIQGDPDFNPNYPGACPAFTDADGELPPGGTIKNYSDALLEWQKDYDAAAKTATGQTQNVPLFISQYSGWKDAPRSKIPPLQLDAHVRAPGKVILVAPTYMLDFQGDYLHFTSESQRKLGEYFAKAYAETVLGGRPWEPLRPIAITRAGAVVTVKLKVPKPPIVIDTTRVTDPGKNGFEFFDDSGAPPAIASVAVSGPDTVVLTLASTPTGGNQRVRYAMKATQGDKPGPQEGPRGNLRDSDATPSQYGNELFNWAVHFDLPVQ
jgi:hypothetical protein